MFAFLVLVSLGLLGAGGLRLLRPSLKQGAEGKKTWAAIGIGFTLFVIGASGITAAQPPVAISSVAPTERVASKAGPTVPYLGGLVAADVYLNLTKEPYALEREATAAAGDQDRYTVRKVDSDTGAHLVVDTFTHKGTKAVKVLAKVQGSNVSAAAWLLPYVATVPIDGVNSAAAKSWTAANWSKVRSGREVSKQFGSVVFTLKGDKNWRSLGIQGKTYDAWQATL